MFIVENLEIPIEVKIIHNSLHHGVSRNNVLAYILPDFSMCICIYKYKNKTILSPPQRWFITAAYSPRTREKWRPFFVRTVTAHGFHRRALLHFRGICKTPDLRNFTCKRKPSLFFCFLKSASLQA